MAAAYRLQDVTGAVSGGPIRCEIGPRIGKEAAAKLSQAKATLDQARVDLDKTVVMAPMDGAILKVNVRLGEYAHAGVLSDPLMTMGSVDPLHVRVDLTRPRPGGFVLATPRLPACAAIPRSRRRSPLSASSPMFCRNGH